MSAPEDSPVHPYTNETGEERELQEWNAMERTKHWERLMDVVFDLCVHLCALNGTASRLPKCHHMYGRQPGQRIRQVYFPASLNAGDRMSLQSVFVNVNTTRTATRNDQISELSTGRHELRCEIRYKTAPQRRKDDDGRPWELQSGLVGIATARCKGLAEIAASR